MSNFSISSLVQRGEAELRAAPVHVCLCAIQRFDAVHTNKFVHIWMEFQRFKSHYSIFIRIYIYSVIYIHIRICTIWYLLVVYSSANIYHWDIPYSCISHLWVVYPMESNGVHVINIYRWDSMGYTTNKFWVCLKMGDLSPQLYGHVSPEKYLRKSWNTWLAGFCFLHSVGERNARNMPISGNEK